MPQHTRAPSARSPQVDALVSCFLSLFLTACTGEEPAETGDTSADADTDADTDTDTMTGSLGSYERGTAAVGSDVALTCSTVAVLPAGADGALIVGGEVAAAFTGDTAAAVF